MAGLQLASYLPMGVMLPYNKTEAPGLHSAKQDPYGQGDCAQWSSMGHQRNSIQRKLLSKKELIVLDNVYTHPQWDTFVKARSYSYPRCAGISQQDSETNLQGQGKGLFYSSDPQSSHSWRAKANCQDAIPFTKKRVGVDRAYPLKPVLHQKSHSAGEACVDEDQNISPRPPEPRDFSYSSFCSRNLVNPSVVGPVVATQGQRARAKPNRTEQMQIQRLEAEGVTLEEEIRRKETLLREKLKKTEEELRRIQKEKDEAKGNEKGDIQRTTVSQKRVKSNRSNSRYKALFSPEFGPEEVFSRHRREGKTWGQLQDNFSPFQFSDCGIQRIKRERPVTSYNKIQDEISGPSAEKLPQSSEALGIALWGPTSSSSLSGALDSSSSSCCTEEPKLGECSHCGRKFHLLRLEKHSSVCSRMQGSKRKVFDSSRARAKGTELEQYLNWKGPASVQAEPPRKNNWRQKHESFIRTLRQAREIQQIIAKGGSPSELPPILPVENPDYIQCPHCSRHFAPKVAERHIPKCKTIKNRPPPPRRHCS